MADDFRESGAVSFGGGITWFRRWRRLRFKKFCWGVGNVNFLFYQTSMIATRPVENVHLLQKRLMFDRDCHHQPCLIERLWLPRSRCHDRCTVFVLIWSKVRATRPQSFIFVFILRLSRGSRRDRYRIVHDRPGPPCLSSECHRIIACAGPVAAARYEHFESAVWYAIDHVNKVRCRIVGHVHRCSSSPIIHVHSTVLLVIIFLDLFLLITLNHRI